MKGVNARSKPRARARRRSRRHSRLEFASIEIEGGLLPVDVISRIAASEAKFQKPDDYRILKGLNMRDEIARYFRIAKGQWEVFKAARAITLGGSGGQGNQDNQDNQGDQGDQGDRGGRGGRGGGAGRGGPPSAAKNGKGGGASTGAGAPNAGASRVVPDTSVSSESSNASATSLQTESFVRDLLGTCFGHETLAKSSVQTVSGRPFPVNYQAEDGRIPIAIAPAADGGSRRSGIDEPQEAFGDGSRKRSATQLVQEYLNASEECLWGIATDGLTLRVLRDNASLTRPAWIEINLERILEEGLFSDFSAAWLLVHASRFGMAGTTPSDCPLERWREGSRSDGIAAKENLRVGVEAALIELGCGFLEHAENGSLREGIASGRLSGQGYFETLLRLVYRLIFLFAAEDRNLLHAEDVPKDARKAYERGYSLSRLRERCRRHASLDRNVDAWEGMKALFTALANGQPALGLTALGGLFETEALEELSGCKIANRRFLKALWRLSWFQPEGQPVTRVNWRDMETEELGSIYESLLELTPMLDLEARSFTFAEGDATRGNPRKVSGSYYTPDSLVNLVLDSALDPVLGAAEGRNPDDPASELLKLSIVDPACGSGHFLLGAARRVAGRIARLRSPGSPSKFAFQHALREVVGNCIHGVDRNPLAVELCKVALWIEAMEPGMPLSFLDARIQCGDSLVGVFDYETLRQGVPDAAYKAMSGDNKDVAKAYARLNKSERDGQASSGFLFSEAAPQEIEDGSRKIAEMPEDSLAEVRKKRRAYEELVCSERFSRLRDACDMYIAAFFVPKEGEVPTPEMLSKMAIPTTGAIWRALDGAGRADLPPQARQTVDVAVEHARPLHWPLAYPAVMAGGGFDVVVGNPPWERVQLEEQEFFASRDPEIAQAKNKSVRTKLIAKLATAQEGSPERVLHGKFVSSRRANEAASEFVRSSGRYPLCGMGKINTYAIFGELFASLARKAGEGGSARSGRAGVIVPTGIATDKTTSKFFGSLVALGRLMSLFDFENKSGLFPSVHKMFKFSCLTIGAAENAEFAFFLGGPEDLEDGERRFSLSPEEIASINPETKTAPVFRSRADAELTAKVYSRIPILSGNRGDGAGTGSGGWGVEFQQMFNMSTDSPKFRTADALETEGASRVGPNWETADGEKYVPLYEAKLIHHFDHRWATFPPDGNESGARDVSQAEKRDPNFEPTCRYWVPEDEVKIRASRVPQKLKAAYQKGDKDGCLKEIAEWVLGYLTEVAQPGDTDNERHIERELVNTLGSGAMSTVSAGKGFASWVATSSAAAIGSQMSSPLTHDDIDLVRDNAESWIDLAHSLIERKYPTWLMGWRLITNVTNERTIVGGVFPRWGVGNSLPVWHVSSGRDPSLIAVLCGMLSSIVLDFFARQKLGGTNFNFFYARQLPVLGPDEFDADEVESVSRKVLELTYTSYAMKPWADALGHSGPVFPFEPERRAHVRAELDGFFAKKFGLSRDELRYILDPADIKGDSYPSETFRILKERETQQHGEYLTGRLVLDAFDRLTGN